MKNRFSVVAVVTFLCAAAPLAAQEPGPVVAPPLATNGDTAAVRPVRLSVIDRPSDAVRREDLIPAAPLPATGQNLGEAKAEMAVGGAGIVVGALIGGDGGSVLMFGGALVGLYGLWNYLR